MTAAHDQTDAPFLTTTEYQVWFRFPGQKWRLWGARFTEAWQAEEEAARVETSTAIAAREVRVARKVTTTEWLAVSSVSATTETPNESEVGQALSLEHDSVKGETQDLGTPFGLSSEDHDASTERVDDA